MNTDQRFRFIFPWCFVLAIICVAAIAVRFALAPYRDAEFRPDTLRFQVWGYTAAVQGVSNIYRVPITYPSSVAGEAKIFGIDSPFSAEVDYLPGYVYLLRGTEALKHVFTPGSVLGDPTSSFFQKLPGVIFDVATAILLFFIVRERFAIIWAWLVAAVYLAHPAILYLSAGWGQVDTFYTFFLVLTVWLMQKQKWNAATIAFTIGFFVKIQSLALLPLFVFELIRTGSSQRIIKTTFVALVTTAVINLPYLLSGHLLDVAKVILGAAGHYPVVSASAFNFWWVVSGGAGINVLDSTLVLGVPLVIVGAILYTIIVAAILWRYAKQVTTDTRWLAAALCVLAFFLFPTEMHERYMFPVFALLLPLFPTSKAVRWLFVGLSGCYIANLIYALFWPLTTSGAWPIISTGVSAAEILMFGALLFLLARQTSPHSIISTSPETARSSEMRMASAAIAPTSNTAADTTKTVA